MKMDKFIKLTLAIWAGMDFERIEDKKEPFKIEIIYKGPLTSSQKFIVNYRLLNNNPLKHITSKTNFKFKQQQTQTKKHMLYIEQ